MQKRLPMPKEYIEKLRRNPYVSKVTERSVSFTPEFKRIAYNEYYNGKCMRQFFTEAGIDVEIHSDQQSLLFLYFSRSNSTPLFELWITEDSTMGVNSAAW